MEMKLINAYATLLRCRQTQRLTQRLLRQAHTVSKLEQHEIPTELTSDQLDKLEENVKLRNHKNNVPIIRQLVKTLQNCSNDTAADATRQQLDSELQLLPNATHPRLLDYGEQPRELVNYAQRDFSASGNFKEFSELCRQLNLCRMDHLGNYTGHKSYYLTGQLAQLEQAIIQYALRSLSHNGFKLISVPDILPKEIIESCGMRTEGERTQVYKLDNGECLSGTSEMALAGYFSNKILDEAELPLKVAAVSRCYRAETSGLHEEKGIYRVHQFTKVEMFAVTSPDQSEQTLEQFKDIEMSLFQKLNINIRLLDMPPCELGAPAYQKYDIEAWMPGRKMWGEISSCSNCTDYQAKRLQIKYKRSSDGQVALAHTINGTATAIPRLLIALVETHQKLNSNNVETIEIPEVLVPFMASHGHHAIVKDKRIPETKLVKFIKAA